MDLLTGYGSDASDNDDDDLRQPASAPSRGTGTSTKVTALPAERPARAGVRSETPEVEPSGSADSKLWSKLPKPSTQPTSTSGLSALPPPSGNSRSGRKVVTLQLPFQKELLAAALDSDDDDVPAAKRVETTGGKSRLMDFLPPPKHDVGSAPAFGSLAASGAAKGPSAGSGACAKAPAAAPQAQAQGSGGAGSLPADFFAGAAGGTMPYGNEAYRVTHDDAADAGAGGYTYAAATGAGAYASAPAPAPAAAQYYGYDAQTAASYYGPGPDYRGAGPPYYAAPGAVAPPSGQYGSAAAAGGGPPGSSEAEADLLEEALRAEQERASKRGGGGGGSGVKLVEIKAADLTRMDPAAREAANSAREALGPEYALSLRRSAQPFEGSKTARRKHQIGTLLFNARMQELDQLEKRTQGQKSKAETAAKYGW